MAASGVMCQGSGGVLLYQAEEGGVHGSPNSWDWMRQIHKGESRACDVRPRLPHARTTRTRTSTATRSSSASNAGDDDDDDDIPKLAAWGRGEDTGDEGGKGKWESRLRMVVASSLIPALQAWKKALHVQCGS